MNPDTADPTSQCSSLHPCASMAEMAGAKFEALGISGTKHVSPFCRALAAASDSFSIGFLNISET